jgi:hypothetical protein
MENYTLKVDYEVSKHKTYMKDVVYNFIPEAILSFYNGDNLLVTQALNGYMCEQMLDIVNKNSSGSISTNITLTELELYIDRNILTISVGYGGPTIYIKILSCLINALTDMNSFFRKDLYTKNFSKDELKNYDKIEGSWMKHYTS